MTEKVGLKIVELLHEITQLNYSVQFYPDFEGMIRITFQRTKPWQKEIEEHSHLGYPECERLVLEKRIISALKDFRDSVKKD